MKRKSWGQEDGEEKRRRRRRRREEGGEEEVERDTEAGRHLSGDRWLCPIFCQGDEGTPSSWRADMPAGKREQP